jgi:hypothetical protein
VRIAREGLARLDWWSPEPLTPEQQTSTDVMRWQLQAIVATSPSSTTRLRRNR